MQYSALETLVKEKNLKIDLDLLRLAYEWAEDAHKGQVRHNGEPYITHPLEAAYSLIRIGLDQDTIIAALLHDVPEDTTTSLHAIEKDFGKDVAFLVAGVTKLGKVKYRGMERYVENLRSMFVAMAQDIRVILIRFADRLHNLETLDALPKEKQVRIAKETLEIYVPIADRLGIGDFKDRLEEAAFKYAMPEEYAHTHDLVATHLDERLEALSKSRATLEEFLKEKGIQYDVIQGRHKALYSLYKKLVEKQGDIQKIHDLVALRVITDSVSNCYAILGFIHELWRPVPNRIKDFIAQPKPNGYQSLHTTVFGEHDTITEFQIRTHDMHSHAEYGIAAHWGYKEKEGELPKALKEWVNELAQWHNEVPDATQYLESIKLEMFEKRIFVFTPKGDVIDLPEKATPVDFAYRVHSDLGNHCVGVYVNDHMVSLNTELKSGDLVSIIVDKNRKGPSLDWLEFVITHQARDRIRSYHKRR